MDFQIKQGNLPTIAATLLDAAGAPLVLTGASVSFSARSATATLTGAARILSATAGTVDYTFTTGQTDAAGYYEGEWLVSFANGTSARHPLAGFVTFEILEPLLATPPANVTPLRSLREYVRAVLGDFDATCRRYEDSAIDGCLRAVVQMGRVTGCTLTADQRGLTPALGDDSARQLGQAIYHTAKMLLLPNAAASSYRMRALSESFGDQRHFLYELENLLYALDNPTQFECTQQFVSWLRATTGCPGVEGWPLAGGTSSSGGYLDGTPFTDQLTGREYTLVVRDGQLTLV